jgi:hypothetical protein
MSKVTDPNELECAMRAAYALGWRDRHAVGGDVASGAIEASESDLASPPAQDAYALRVAEEG